MPKTKPPRRGSLIQVQAAGEMHSFLGSIQCDVSGGECTHRPPKALMMNGPALTDLQALDDILDEYQVEIMIYEPRLDASWVEIYQDDPIWEIESGDDDFVAFSRCRKVT